jgi:hypothetical protein
MNILYSINRYDSDGDISEEGVYLHFDDNIIIKVSDNIKEFNKIVESILIIHKEINT